MIRIRLGELADTDAVALLRPVTTEWAAVTPAMRRLELAAGPELLEQCERLGELPVGSAVITGAGALAAQFMVHVAVRSREDPVSAAIVQRAMRNGLRRLTEWAIESVAVAPIGTGAGNLDAEAAADAMIAVLMEHMATAAHPTAVEIAVDTEYERDAFERRLARATGPEPLSPPLPGDAAELD